MNIKQITVVGFGVLLWASQTMASQWDDQINQWKKESTNLKAEHIPQLEEAAKSGNVRATYLLYLEADNARFEYAKRSSANQLGQFSQRIADAGNPIGMRMLCYLLREGKGGLGKDQVNAFEWCKKSALIGLGNAMSGLGVAYRDGIGVKKDATEAVKWFQKGTDLKDGTSMASLGAMYRDGVGVTKDEAEAVKLFRRGADLNNAYSISSLGALYRDGTGVTKDEAEAAKLFRRGADLNNAYSISSLGALYRDGRGVTKDEDEAAKLFRRGADLNDAYSISSLGAMYRDGRGVAKDEAEAAKLFQRGADLKDVYSMSELGDMYLNGAGVNLNETEAFTWYRKAADLNDAHSIANLGIMYRDGLGVKKNIVEALKMMRKGADLNHRDSITSLGQMYRDGIGVEKDASEAVKFYRRAADLKSINAVRSLAEMYLKGDGVSKDKVEAIKWYSKGADLNDGISILSLGLIYYDFKGVGKGYDEAIKYFRRAADLNITNSIFLLGTMYLNGQGVNSDSNEAIKWFRKGADLNHKGSISILGSMYASYEGKNFTKDYAEAVKWYIRGVDLNDAVSINGLGLMYINGTGVPKDFDTGINLFRKGAELNNSDSMVYLGDAYRTGRGVPKNEVESFGWFRKAANLGNSVGMTELAESYQKGKAVARNSNEAGRLYAKSISADAGVAMFIDTNETGSGKARRLLDAMLAAGEITDPDVLREVRALSKPAPKAEWVQAPQTTGEEEVTFKFNVVDGGGGIGDVSFKLNGVALNVAQGRNASVIELVNTNVRTFTFRLPPGKHDVEVIAYNAENLINWTSLKSTVTSTFKPIRKPQLHAVIVGINDYENDKLKLRFATNDATEVAKVLKTSGEKLYDQVHVKLLNNRNSTGKVAILQAIKEAASKAQTEDVFIFYVAGHGQNFDNNGYHMLTADVGVMTDKAVQANSISAQELQLAIANVPSGKKVVLLDTCQSGGGLDASKLISVRGGIDNLDMVKDMNRKSGAIVLAAAESKEDAMEGYQGHGVFTFALLEALKGKADTKGDGIVSTFQLQEYVADRTYQLAQQAFNGKKQSPYTSGSNGFPFLKWK